MKERKRENHDLDDETEAIPPSPVVLPIRYVKAPFE
jgi:hypothetical protein